MAKKWVIGGAAALAVAVGGWTAFWFVAASEAERLVDERIEALAAQGVSVTYGERAVTGFPFAHELDLRDVAVESASGGWRVETDWLRGVAEGERAVLRVAPNARIRLAGEPPVVAAVESEALTVHLAPEDGAIVADIAAPRADVAATGAGEIEAALEGIDLRVIGGVPGVHVLGGEIDRVEAAIDRADPAGGALSATFALSGVSVESRGSGLDGVPLIEAVKGEGAAELRLSAEAVEAEGERAAAGGAPSPFSLAAADFDMRLGAARGRALYALDATRARWGLAGGGAVEGATLSVGFDTPIGPAADPLRYTARVAVEGAAPDAALWERLDPGERLPRAPLRLDAALAGASRVRDGAVRAETIEIERAQVEGLGAEASLEGALTLDAFNRATDGALRIRMTGWRGALGALESAGAIGAQELALATALAQVYGREDAADGAFETEIRFDQGRISANGRPLQ